MGFPLDNNLTLQGQVAYVTGASRGIGWATAELFAQYGASVILGSREITDSLIHGAQSLQGRYNVEVLPIAANALDAAAVKDSYRQILAHFGRLDILVNNAGVLEDALIGMITDEMIATVLGVNLIGAIHNVQSASRVIRRSRDGGSIVNLSSIVGVVGNEGQIVYSASKSGVIGLTKSAAKELAPFGIRVNAVAPGFIDTDMTRSLPPAKHSERMQSIRMGRIGTPVDVASVILFLVSGLSRYVTGQVVGVDGGMTI